MSRRVPELVALGLILAAAAVLHAAALRAPFFADDYLFLDQVRGRSLPAAVASPDPLGNYLRPVSRQFWFWTVASVSGETPVAFHALNLALLALAVALLFSVARARLGPFAAIVAAAAFALHTAADVPVRWASGSQDLLAVALALAAIRLHIAGRRGAAAAALVLALLSKETVLFAPAVAVLLDRREREPWRATVVRGWPLGAAFAAWAVLWLSVAGRRPTIGHDVQLEPAGILAALVHLVQAAVGYEWGSGRALQPPLLPPLVPLLLVLIAIAVVLVGRSREPSPPVTKKPSRAWIGIGLAWAVLGALPVIAVASIWSSYFYLFAIAGVGFTIGAVASRSNAWVGVTLVVLMVWGSQQARALDEFATRRGKWTSQSHLNRFYLDRGMLASEHYLQQLRTLRPTLPSRSTLFFAGVPGSVAFQAADGPLVRWAYRDTSLRSYFLTGFSLARARRGPVILFEIAADSLSEITGPDSLPAVAFAMMVSESPAPARDALLLAVERDPNDQASRDLIGWTSIALGDTATAWPWLGGDRPLDSGPAPQVPAIFAAFERGDTLGAIALAQIAVVQHVLDPGAHALLADLLLASERETANATVQAYAARVLAPHDAGAWRRWGMVQVLLGRRVQAAESLERYRTLGGDSARADEEINRLLAALRRQLPGGDLVQAGLREIPTP